MVGLLRGTRLLVWLLLGVDFLDEWSSGVPSLGAPGIQAEFGVSYGMAAGWVLAVPLVLAVLLEPPIFLLADRHPRRWFVCGGLLALGGLCFAQGLAPSFWVLLGLLFFTGTAGGAAISLAQATLMDADPARRERTMARWTLFGATGDLAVPLTFAAL